VTHYEAPRSVMRAARSSSGGLIPLRLELKEGAATNAYWRAVPNMDHGTLCRAFNLDPIRHRWDLPTTAHQGTGSRVSGYGGSTSGSRLINGILLRNGEPVGKVSVVRDGDRFWDYDPEDHRDFYNLERQ
jgi:hypothetical protein